MNKILSLFSVTGTLLMGLAIGISAADNTPSTKIPDELIAGKLKKHDAALAISVEAVLYKLKRSQPITLVDVRRRQAFERLHIPGSVNIPLYAVKAKAFLKFAPVVLVNEGLRYSELQNECRRLAERGFKVSILDGGLPAWERKEGKLVGDFLALDAMTTVSPKDFFRAKDYTSTQVLDISSKRSHVASQLLPYAKHFPVLDGSKASMAGLRKLITMNNPFHSIIIFNETGEGNKKAKTIMRRRGVQTYNLAGGIAGYQNYLEGLVLSWKTRDSRLVTVGNCKPCGKKSEEE
jgi:rhodanese-related sulfurtransferase